MINNMNVRKVSQNKFTIISNHYLNDEELSLKAKGLLAFILSKPEDWNFSIKGLVSQLKEGRDAIGNIIAELEKKGYLLRIQQHDQNGKFTASEYVVFEDIEDQKEYLKNLNEKNTVAGNTDAGFSGNGKSAPSNTIISNTIISNTNYDTNIHNDKNISLEDSTNTVDVKEVIDNAKPKVKSKNLSNISKDELINSFISDNSVKKAFKKFLEYRESKNAKCSNQNIFLLLKSLTKITKDTKSQIDIINHSIERGWVGLFEIKSSNARNYIPTKKETRIKPSWFDDYKKEWLEKKEQEYKR